jgi:hypothetical protein
VHLPACVNCLQRLLFWDAETTQSTHVHSMSLFMCVTFQKHSIGAAARAQVHDALALTRSSGSGPVRISVLTASSLGTEAAASGAPTLIFMTRWLWQKKGVSLVVTAGLGLLMRYSGVPENAVKLHTYAHTPGLSMPTNSLSLTLVLLNVIRCGCIN